MGTRPVRTIGEDLGKILGVRNHDGELLEFEEPVKVSDKIEMWLKRVELSMKFNVARTMQHALNSYRQIPFMDWIKLWPTQFLLVILEITLTQQLKVIMEPEIPKKMTKGPSVIKSDGNAFAYSDERYVPKSRVNEHGQAESPV